MKPKLIIASSEHNADMYYATRILIPDDFIFLEIGGKKIIYVSDLEYLRACAQAQVDEVINVFSRPAKYKSTLAWIIAENNLKEIMVPENFPIVYAEALRKLKVKMEMKSGMFFEERSAKDGKETKAIRATQKVNEKAMRSTLEMIKKSRIRKDGKLEYQGKILTSEFLKEVIGIEFLKGGCKSHDDIVSCGRQTAQPHNEGSGPLYANQPIIIDIYPKSSKSQYFADMTRTVVKGRASEEIKKLYQTVLEGQKLAIGSIKSGVAINFVDGKVREFFEESGYKTELGVKNPQGFIHNLGHGVGLEIHEHPFLSPKNDQKLEAGNVITIEPGLYYSELGGVRIEDMVLVKETGCENMTKFPKFLEIK